MLTELNKSQFTIQGERGLPETYPVPQNIDNLLFYIQRNLNTNTVVYALNEGVTGSINEDYPMRVFWIKYSAGGTREALNYIQTKAFGYSASKISNGLYEFNMDSYHVLRFFIVKNVQDQYQIITKMNGQDAQLHNIYVYANEFGLFPKVEYIELYGTDVLTQFPTYQKILI